MKFLSAKTTNPITSPANNLEPKAPKRSFLGFGPVAVVLVTVFAYFASQFVAVILIAYGAKILGKNSDSVLQNINSSVSLQFLTFVLIEAVTLLIVWSYMRSKKVSLETIGVTKKIKSQYLAYGVLAFIIYFIVLTFVMALVSKLVPAINLDQSQEVGFDNAKSAGALVMTFISLAILPPLAEEIVFRGFLYSGLRTKLKPVLAGLIVCVVFATAHLQLGSGNPPLWVASIDTFILSGFLVYLREKTGSIWAGVVVHFLKNGLAFLFLFVLKTGGM